MAARVRRSLLVGMLLASCAASDRVATPATPVTTLLPVPASSLAASQVVASTVARPETPAPCDPGQLAFATTVGAADPATVAVITIVNQGPVWCEVDVFESRDVDPLMEPDVWLDPGAAAELVVSDGEPGCSDPSTSTAIELVVNGEPIVVATDPLVACARLLTAIYPL